MIYIQRRVNSFLRRKYSKTYYEKSLEEEIEDDDSDKERGNTNRIWCDFN